MKNPHCLAGLQRALRLRAQMRLERAVAVEAGDRQQVQQERGHLQEAQERHRRPRTPRAPGRRAAGSAPSSTHREHQVGGRAGQADQRLLPLRHDHDVRTYTAPPGRPMPPSAMNSTGSPSDSSGCEYFNGFSVR